MQQVMTNVKAKREQAKLTQKDVAEGLGISTTTYNNYETGARTMGIADLVRLTTVLGCKISDLLPESVVTTYDRQRAKDPKLQRIIDLWPDLPEFLRDGLAALADNYDQQKGGH